MITQHNVDSFIKKSISVHGNRYNYSKVQYVNNKTKIDIECSIHGIFQQTPSGHMSGRGCSGCKIDKLIKRNSSNTEEFVMKSKKLHQNVYDYSATIYVNNSSKVSIICHNHGVFEQTPSDHLQAYGCPRCAAENLSLRFRSNINEFVEKANQIHQNRYDYSKVDYVNCKTKITIICPKHNEFNQIPRAHLEGQGCPVCRSSKGEMLISQILDKNHIHYLREYKIPETAYRFEYDFYLPDYKLLIEFHGIQHYEAVEHFGGEETFKITQFRDKVKYSLAKETGHKIVYFNYKDVKKYTISDFENILLKSIRIHGRIINAPSSN